MREELGGEDHQDGSEAERHRGGRPVARLEAVGDPPDEQQQEHRGHDGREQRQDPDDRSRILDPRLDTKRTGAVVTVGRVRGLVVGDPARVVGTGGVGGGVGGELAPAGAVDQHVERGGDRRHPGRLDRVVVAVYPGNVTGLPMPAVDRRLPGRERADLREMGYLGPPHRVDHRPPSDSDRDDRERRAASSRPGAQPALNAHAGDLQRAIVQGSGLRTSTTSTLGSRKRTKRSRDQ